MIGKFEDGIMRHKSYKKTRREFLISLTTAKTKIVWMWISCCVWASAVTAITWIATADIGYVMFAAFVAMFLPAAFIIGVSRGSSEGYESAACKCIHPEFAVKRAEGMYVNTVDRAMAWLARLLRGTL